MSRSKSQPALLRYIHDTLEAGEELDTKQRSALLVMVNDALEERRLEVSLAEFHRWVRLGESILTEAEKELANLRALAAGGDNIISIPMLHDILDKYRNHRPKNEVDNGVNWVLDKVAEEVERRKGDGRDEVS